MIYRALQIDSAIPEVTLYNYQLQLSLNWNQESPREKSVHAGERELYTSTMFICILDITLRDIFVTSASSYQ